jgi:hypothetical protein
MKQDQPPPAGSPVAFGGDSPPQPGDYSVPPANYDYVPPANVAPLPSQRRHAILAYICVATFPLGFCSLSLDEFVLRPSWPLALHLGLLIATFCLPMFALGRSKGGPISSRMFWSVLALFGMTIAVALLRASG